MKVNKIILSLPQIQELATGDTVIFEKNENDAIFISAEYDINILDPDLKRKAQLKYLSIADDFEALLNLFIENHKRKHPLVKISTKHNEKQN